MRINPGELFATSEPVVISTLLGSCVSACIWDSVNKVSGMNHFLLAQKKYGLTSSVLMTDEGRYGVHAMDSLINKIINLGGNRKYLKAKALGGGNVLLNPDRRHSSDLTIGAVNATFIRNYLTENGIPLVSHHLGGDIGRMIYFDTCDYSVYVKKVDIKKQSELVQKEREYYHQRLVDDD